MVSGANWRSSKRLEITFVLTLLILENGLGDNTLYVPKSGGGVVLTLLILENGLGGSKNGKYWLSLSMGLNPSYTGKWSRGY